MKRVLYHQYGSLDGLRIVDVPAPVVTPRTMLVQVKAVSINPLDWKIVQGEMKMMTGRAFPKGIGIDFSGVVTAVGEHVSGFAIGDAVMGALDAMKGPGALAEVIAVQPSQVVHKPARIGFEQAAALPIVGAAALQGLTKALQLRAGQNLLIHGATGGVGMVAIQLAQKMGVHVTAVVSSRGMEWAKRWGATHLVNYQDQAVRDLSERFDAAMDLSTKLPFAEARLLLKPNGSYLNAVPSLKDILLTPLANLTRSQKVKVLMSSPDPATLKVLAGYAEDGLDIHVGERFAWTEFAHGYVRIRQKGVLGKAVFVMDEAR